MLTITVPGIEVFDDSNGEFTTQGDVTLELEHSLVSLSKWESEFEKPFLSKDDKAAEEIMRYVRLMALTPRVPEEVFLRLSQDNYNEIQAYINAKMSATWFSEAPGGSKSTEVITAELIYYWMTVYNIDFRCETWHLNRLFTLIRICNLKQSKPKKMSRAEAAARQRELNTQRRATTGSKG